MAGQVILRLEKLAASVALVQLHIFVADHVPAKTAEMFVGAVAEWALVSVSVSVLVHV